MNDQQIAAWKRALADHAAAGRRQRYRPRKSSFNVRGAGMGAGHPQANGPHKAGRSQHERLDHDRDD